MAIHGYTRAMHSCMTSTADLPQFTLVELDSRRRVSLGRLGRHRRYLVREEKDGTLIFEPAVMSDDPPFTR